VPKASVSVSVALVGDGGVGKTSLLLSFLSGKCPADYLPGPADWHSGK
jgi:GTPase SAR1 family protein